MPLLNYTTEVPAAKSVGEIVKMLQEGGAQAIMMENNAAREVDAISFRLETAFGPTMFKLPANVGSVILTINAEIKKENVLVSQRRRYNRKVPVRLFNDKAQAERIAWRIVKDWMEAQLALNEVGAAKLEQVMLPFSVDAHGNTLYDRFLARRSLALPSSEPKRGIEEAIPVN